MRITRKSLLVHEFPARVCCGGVLWVRVPSGVVGCGSVWLLHCLYVCIASAVCDFLISTVWRKLTKKESCIKFCVRLGKTGSETFEMLKQAFGDSCMSRSRTFVWLRRFKNGRTSTANDDRSGRPSTITTPSKLEQVGRLATFGYTPVLVTYKNTLLSQIEHGVLIRKIRAL